MKTLIAVNNCFKYLNRRIDCERTWVQIARDNGFDCRYVYMSENEYQTDHDLHFQGKENYENLSLKLSKTIKYALDHNFDYLFKCDDDTYVDLVKFSKEVTIERKAPFYQAIQCHEGKIGHAFGGNGHLLNRYTMEKIIDKFSDRELTKMCPVDDYLMAYCLKLHNIPFAKLSQYDTYTWHYVFRQGFDLLHQQINGGQQIVPYEILYRPEIVTTFWRICNLIPYLDQFKMRPEELGEGINDHKQGIWIKGISLIDNLKK